MIYEPPRLDGRDEQALANLDVLRGQLARYVYSPRRWFGTIRRAAFARAVQGSNSIEGINASVEDVAAMVADEPPLDARDEIVLAIAGYRDAMTYVLQLAQGEVVLDQSLIRSLHFMIMKYDLAKNPGQWRPGAIWVHDTDGHVVYDAPERDSIESLIAELVLQANDTSRPAVVTAAMAHLNLALIHPFSDGNGRMARCVQSLVLARAGSQDSIFSSIEEYLGRNTSAYYDVLAQVGGGLWQPSRDTRPWIEFCIRAHVQQATTQLHRISETEELWDRCEQLATVNRLPTRTVAALCEGALGRRLRRGLYQKVVVESTGEDISEQSATRDLAALVASDLFEAQGQKRGRIYVPSRHLRSIYDEIRKRRADQPALDPYSVDLSQQTLPL